MDRSEHKWRGCEGVAVGTGAVVMKDVSPWMVVGGNPAKFIKKREMVVSD